VDCREALARAVRPFLVIRALRTGAFHLGKVLVYDPVLAREAVMEVRAPKTVTLMLAKR
jgi:hypothetical protein